MTNEEANYYLKSSGFSDEQIETIARAYENSSYNSVKTELDCISRQAVLDLCESKDPEYKVRHFKEDVECLPPISSHESKTVLYSGDGYADGYMVYDIAECPNCGYEYEDGDKDWGLPFCPKCGQSLNWGSEVKE